MPKEDFKENGLDVLVSAARKPWTTPQVIVSRARLAAGPTPFATPDTTSPQPSGPS